jgi:hypothetical protein
MSKRTLLSQAVKTNKPTPASVGPQAVESVARTPSRIGTRMLGFHVPEPVQRQFKVLAAEQGKTVHALLQEAVNDVFRKYAKGTIA